MRGVSSPARGPYLRRHFFNLFFSPGLPPQKLIEVIFSVFEQLFVAHWFFHTFQITSEPARESMKDVTGNRPGGGSPATLYGADPEKKPGRAASPAARRGDHRRLKQVAPCGVGTTRCGD